MNWIINLDENNKINYAIRNKINNLKRNKQTDRWTKKTSKNRNFLIYLDQILTNRLWLLNDYNWDMGMWNGSRGSAESGINKTIKYDFISVYRMDMR